MSDIIMACDHALAAAALLEDAEARRDASLEAIAFDAIAYNLIVVGEAVKALPPEVRRERPEVPWVQIAGMRDVLAHRYFHVDATVVRSTVDSPLRELTAVCRRMLGD